MERKYLRRLREEEASQIKLLLALEISQTEIAKIFGVRQQTIGNIHNDIAHRDVRPADKVHESIRPQVERLLAS